MPDNPKLNFNNFEDIKVSTKTYVASTNINIDLKKLFEIIEITPYTVKKKKRGRRKKTEIEEDYNNELKEGSIVTSKWEGFVKGCELKPPKKNNKGETTWFRNSVTIVIFLDKFINFKVCKSGTLQFTGCKNWEHAKKCVKKLWNILMNTDIYTFKEDCKELEVFIVPSMRNIDFELGFLIDREKLSNYTKKSTDTHCLLETSFGYTGVSVKFPIYDEDRMKMFVKKINCLTDGEWKEEWSDFKTYLSTLSEKERKQKLKNQKYNTFLIFHSGKVIFSGPNSYMMKNTYVEFCKIIKNGFENIVEVLDK